MRQAVARWTEASARAEGVANALMTKANSKDRNLFAESTDDFVGKARFFRRARARRDEDTVRLQRTRLVERDLVVAPNLHGRIQLAEILNQIIRERIVVIDHQDHAANLGSAAAPRH